MGALTKLYQMTMVREYQNEFEKLSNCIGGLDEAFFCIYFISGLKEEIQIEFKIFNPRNIIVVIGLTKLVEDKFNA